MTLKELQSRLTLGRSKSAVVDISLTPELPGFVRTVTIRPEYQVDVEFNSYGVDEGGVSFVGEFDTIEQAVASVEEYLGVPLSEWSVEPEYPPELSPPQPVDAEDLLAAALAARKLPLPRGPFKLRDSYWSRFLPHP